MELSSLLIVVLSLKCVCGNLLARVTRCNSLILGCSSQLSASQHVRRQDLPRALLIGRQPVSKLRSTLLQISIFIIFWSIYIRLWYVLSLYEDAVLQLHLQAKEGGHTGYLQHQGPKESCLPTILRLDTVGAARELCWVVNRLVNLAYKMAPYLNEGLWFGDVRIYWCRAVFRMALYSMNYSTEAKMMVLEISWWAACKLLCQTFNLQLSSG